MSALDAIGGDGPVIVDLSADYRFDADWYYGLPELTRGRYSGQRRISNPGCYATAMQLAIAPMRDVLVGPVQCFGVSGYSGAGTSPSDRNNPDKLRDNLMPYSLAGHVHEAEVSPAAATSGRIHAACGAAFPRAHHHGQPASRPSVHARRGAVAATRDAYSQEPLVRVFDAAPWVSRIAGAQHVDVGGFTLADGRSAAWSWSSTLDNLLKGAATQAMQNLNIAFGFDEFAGIPILQSPRPDSGAA